MDKLIKHKFWILCGLAIPLALAGYFTASGAVGEITKTKIDNYTTALNGVSSGDVENEKFTQRVAVLAEEIRQENEKELLHLWEIQKQWYTWPQLIEKGLPKNKVNGEIQYPGDTEEDAKFEFTLKSVPIDYPQQYTIQMDRLYYSLDPVLYPDAMGKVPAKTKSRVFLESAVIPRHEFLTGVLYPPKKILDAQEDYWLLTMLAAAINNVNQAEDVNKSPIVEIKMLELFGGTGTTTITAAADTSTTGTIESTMPLAGGLNDPTGKGQISFRGSSVSFDAAEEYGARSVAGDSSSSGSVEVATLSNGATLAEELRYVGDPKVGPYRQRAFYLSLLIDETKIPSFFAALSSLDPPIQVGRFAIANNPYDDDDLMRISGFSKGGRSPGLGNYSETNSGRAGISGGGGWDFVASGRTGDSTGNTSRIETSRPYDPRTGGDGLNTTQVVDPYANARMRSDLVRLDVTGLITMFKQPLSIRNAVPVETPPAEQTNPTPNEATGDSTSVSPAADTPAATGTVPATTDPATETTPDPATPTVPDESTVDTPTDPAEGSTPPADVSEGTAPVPETAAGTDS